MHFEFEYMDDGWTKPMPMPAYQLAMIDDLIDYLGEQEVYISTTYMPHAGASEIMLQAGEWAVTDMVDVSFCPESPGALEQLDRLVQGVEKSSRN